MAGNAPAERIYHGGTILTMADTQNTVEAVAVGGGRIIATGSRETVMACGGPATQLIALGGRTLLPGFIDAHGHVTEQVLLWGAINLAPPPVGSVTRIADIIEALRAAAGDAAVSETLAGNGYDDSLLAEQRHPTRQDLDRVSDSRPVVILHTSGHLAVGNTVALERAGFVRGAPDPKGGVVRRDAATDEPTGVVEEQAVFGLATLLPRLSVEQRLTQLAAVQHRYAREGITTAQDGQTSRAGFALLQQAATRGDLLLDIVSYPKWTEVSTLLTPNVPIATYHNRLKVGGVKITQDGSPQGKTAYLSRPYLHPPAGQPAGYRGYPIMAQEELDGWYDRFFAAGYQVQCHTNGDAASDMMLDAVERAAMARGTIDRRSVMIHAQTVREDQLDRMAALGVMPSFFVAHTFFWGDWHRNETLGEKRAFRISPCASALRRGIPFTLHNDAPVVPPAILPLVWSAVNRVSRSGVVVGPEQRITPLQALRAVTLDAARQYFEEEQKGSIEPGKLADLVILAQNPLTIDPMAIRDINVIETIKEGTTIYTAPL